MTKITICDQDQYLSVIVSRYVDNHYETIWKTLTLPEPDLMAKAILIAKTLSDGPIYNYSSRNF